jgi:hypothetical protein
MDEFCIAEPPQVHDFVLTRLALLGRVSQAEGVKAIVARQAAGGAGCSMRALSEATDSLKPTLQPCQAPDLLIASLENVRELP